MRDPNMNGSHAEPAYWEVTPEGQANPVYEPTWAKGVKGMTEVASENTSGQRRSAVVPPEIRGWSWGAFGLNWLWGICNRVWIALLVFIPLFGFIWAIVLGVKGNQWAWQHKKWDSMEHFKSTQKKWGITGVVVFVISLILFIGPTVVPPQPQPMSGTLRLTSWSLPAASQRTSEELRQAVVGVTMVLNPVDPVNDTAYWNTDWDAFELYDVISAVNQDYYETHTYMEGEFVCKEMATGVWNRLYTEGISSVLVIGNLALVNETFAESDHVWLLVTYRGVRLLAVESTNGEVYLVPYDIDSEDKEFKQYLEGYYFASPSEIKAVAGDRW